MLRHLRSNLIAYVALFLALGGGTFAVAAINRHDKRVIKKIVNKQPVPARIVTDETTFTQDQAIAALPDRKY